MFLLVQVKFAASCTLPVRFRCQPVRERGCCDDLSAPPSSIVGCASNLASGLARPLGSDASGALSCLAIRYYRLLAGQLSTISAGNIGKRQNPPRRSDSGICRIKAQMQSGDRTEAEGKRVGTFGLTSDSDRTPATSSVCRVWAWVWDRATGLCLFWSRWGIFGGQWWLLLASRGGLWSGRCW